MDNPAFRPDSEGWKLRDNERIQGNSPPVRSRSGLLDLKCWKPGPSSPLDPGSPISGHWSAACLYGVFVEIASSPGGSAGCSSPDSSRVCIAVGLEREPLERCQWRGQPGTRVFWILDSRGAPDRAAAFSGPRGTNKISEASKTYFLEGNPQSTCSLSPRWFFAVAPGLWILDSGLTLYKPPTKYFSASA